MSFVFSFLPLFRLDISSSLICPTNNLFFSNSFIQKRNPTGPSTLAPGSLRATCILVTSTKTRPKPKLHLAQLTLTRYCCSLLQICLSRSEKCSRFKSRGLFLTFSGSDESAVCNDAFDLHEGLSRFAFVRLCPKPASTNLSSCAELSRIQLHLTPCRKRNITPRWRQLP